MTRQHIHIHLLHPRQPNKSRSQRFTAVNCTLCTASFPPLPPKQHNFFYVATLLLLIVIFDCCFLWRNLFNPFALRLLFSPLRYSPANACAAAFLADTPLCTISSLRPNPLLPHAYLAAHLPRFNILPPLFLLAVQGSAFPGAFVSCGTKALPSAKTSMFIGLLALYAYLCIVFYALHRFASSALSLCPILFRHRLFLLPHRMDLVFATAALHFLVQPSSPFIAFAVGAPSSPFALNSSIDLLFALTADAFCLRRIFAEPPRDRRSLFRLCLLV